MKTDYEGERRNAERHAISVKVEFFVDGDILNARSIDLSEIGIRMTTETPISVRFRMNTDEGESMEKMGQLVWAKRDENGNTDYGLEFIQESETPTF